MSAETDLMEAIRSLSTRAAEFKAFEASLRELNTTLVDLLGRPSAPAPDIAGPLSAALASLKFPAPVVNNPLTVTSGAKPGDKWKVAYTRTAQGGEMVITKL